jgi:hypothetical protein
MAVCRDLVEVGFDTASARVLGFDTATTRQNFTPTITALAPMTILATATIRQASWQYIGDGLVYYQGHYAVQPATAVSNRIDITLPVAQSNTQEGFPVFVRDASSGHLVAGVADIGSGIIAIFKADRSNWSLGTNRRILWRVVYEVDKVL